MRRCLFLFVGWSVSTFGTVLFAAFMVISTAVLTLLVRCAPSATTCPRAVCRPTRCARACPSIQARCARWRAAPAASLPPPHLACCSLPLHEKMSTSRAPPGRSPPSSPNTFEALERFVLADKEGPAQERRHQSVSVSTCSDVVVMCMRQLCESAVAQPFGCDLCV